QVRAAKSAVFEPEADVATTSPPGTETSRVLNVWLVVLPAATWTVFEPNGGAGETSAVESPAFETWVTSTALPATQRVSACTVNDGPAGAAVTTTVAPTVTA